MNIYTESERRVKKYRIADAIAAAKVILGPFPMILDKNLSRNSDFKITLEELNNIAGHIVDDSYCYGP